MTEAVRFTEFTASRPENVDQLERYIRDGQTVLKASRFCLGCEVFRDDAEPSKVVTIERWTDIEARQDAARLIPSSVVQGAMLLMHTAPVSRNLSARTVFAEILAGTERPLNVVLIVASVRNERFGPIIADWVSSIIGADGRFSIVVIDLAAIDLPAALPADPGDLAVPNKRPVNLRPVSTMLSDADAFVMVTPEYNHGLPASLKHFIDWHFVEWRRKPIAAVSYGGLGGGIRAIENLRLVMAELHATVIRDTVSLNAPWELFSEEGNLLNPGGPTGAAKVLFDNLAWWAQALREARTQEAET